MHSRARNIHLLVDAIGRVRAAVAVVAIATAMIFLLGKASSMPSARSEPAPSAIPYSALRASNPGGILTIPPSQARAAARWPAGPIWVAVTPQASNAVLPRITGATELPHRGSFRLWIAPSTRNGICLLVYAPQLSRDVAHAHSVMASCSDATRIREGVMQILGGYGANGASVVFGIVPDGVPSVAISFADGTTSLAPCSANSYALTTTRTVRAVTFRVAHSSKLTEIQLGGPS